MNHRVTHEKVPDQENATLSRKGENLLAIVRSVPRKPRPVGGVKGHNLNNKSLPGSPALCKGSFTMVRKAT